MVIILLFLLDTWLKNGGKGTRNRKCRVAPDHMLHASEEIVIKEKNPRRLAMHGELVESPLEVFQLEYTRMCTLH